MTYYTLFYCQQQEQQQRRTSASWKKSFQTKFNWFILCCCRRCCHFIFLCLHWNFFYAQKSVCVNIITAVEIIWLNFVEFSIKFWTKKFLIIIGVMMIRVFRIGKWKKSILIIRTEAGKLDRISNWPLMIDDGSTTDLMIIISGQSEDDNDGGDDCGILLLSSNMICKLEILDFWIRLTREQNKQNHYHYHQNNLQVNENKQESENMHITPKKISMKCI